MKKNIYYLLMCILQCLGIECSLYASESFEKEGKKQVVKIDITKEYPLKEFVIQDVADVEYIPIETRSDVLLGGTALNHLCVSDSLIVMFNGKEGSVFVFNRQGRILYSFNHIGRSGEEYQGIIWLTVDFKKREIYVYDFVQKYKVLVYDYHGTFKRALKLPESVWLSGMYDYDINYLLCCNDKNMLADIARASKRPYFLLSKRDGKIFPLNLSFTQRMNNVLASSRKTDHNSNSKVDIFDLPVYSMIKNGHLVVIADWASDTLYHFQNSTLIPSVIKTPSGKNATPPILCYATLKTNRFTFMSAVKKVFNESGRVSSLDFVCDHNTGGVYKPSFVNKDFILKRSVAPDAIGSELPENCALYRLSTSVLLKLYETGKLSGKLKDVVSKLQEDDNPVLIIVKFKE